jgi:two-component system, NtrC family, response regulator AtoC
VPELKFIFSDSWAPIPPTKHEFWWRKFVNLIGWHMALTPDVAGLSALMGNSPAIVALRETVRRLLPRLADTNRPPPILIQGETGTGKGLLARTVHRASPRNHAPFVDVNCAAIPETMLEAELFGFERGAFTDARQGKAGLFQAAHQGTLFLDELGLLPGVLQGKLLTALEDRIVRRLGSTRGEPVDAWVMAATSSDLAEAMRAGRFHDALYHRLSVLTLWLPPLRERGADTVALAEHFLARACVDHGLPERRIDDRARSTLTAYPWPGNVRELANVMERVALLTDGPTVTADMLGLGAMASAPTRGPAAPPERAGRLRDRVAGLEREQIAAALRQTRGNITHAAARLGIPVNTLRYRMQKLGVSAGIARSRRPAPRRVDAVGATAAAASSGVVRWQPRRVAVLQTSLDVGGAAASPAESTRAVEAVISKLRSFGGRIEELAPGCVVGAFGVEAVEDAVRRAAHAARAIHAALIRAREEAGAPARARLALHVESFLVGQAFGADAVLDVDAKRRAWATLDALIAITEPDGTVVSAEAAPFLDRRFELLRTRDLPGGARAYLLADAERAGFGVRGRLTPFVGRATELDQLRAWAAALREDRGLAVTVSGEAGIGKSRLLFELRQHVAAHGVRYLEGRCTSYGAPVPYLPFADVVRQLCGITDADDGETVAAKVRHTLAAIGLDPRERATTLLDVLNGSDAPEAGARELPARTFDTIRQLLVASSWQRPLVLAVEDLHWSDPGSEALLARLAPAVSALPILLIATHRTGYRPPWPPLTDGIELTLEPLSMEASRDVLRAAAEADRIPDAVVPAIVSRAEGNPFFLEELARAVGEDPSLVASGRVPATIQEVLLTRFARLDSEEQRILQVAAVVGRDAPLVVLRQVAQLDDERLHSTLARLCAGHFIREGMASGESGYTFTHALTHEVAYGTLATDERRALHRRAVEAIEAAYTGRLDEHRDQLAHHVARGEVWEKALAYFRASIDVPFEEYQAAWRAGAHDRALEQTRRDLVVAIEFKVFDSQIEVRIRRAIVYQSLGEYHRAIELLRENVRDLAGDVPETKNLQPAAARTLSHAWLAVALAELGELDEARRHAADAIAASFAGDDSCHCVASWAMGMAELLDGKPADAHGWLSRAVAHADRPAAADWMPAIAAALGHALVLEGRIAEGLARLRHAVADAEARGLVADHALRLAWAAHGEQRAGQSDRAEALAARAVDIARRCRERGHEAWALLAQANVAAARGDDRAETLRTQALELARSLGMRPLMHAASPAEGPA